jgi:leukotriene-A4 hydrolase
MKYSPITRSILLLLLLAACVSQSPKETSPKMNRDPHTYSDPSSARVKHLSWKATVDFESRSISATATWDFEQQGNPGVIIFDTKGLSIQKVAIDGDTEAQFRLGETDEIMGQPLAVVITPSATQVTIYYKTSPDAEALQWLEPRQTAGKKHPFLFTQSQAILARSWVPCQDSPDVRFTYQAEVTVPRELLPLMSASNPQARNDSGSYSFNMSQPIPSYLLALTVGDVEFSEVSARSGVYAEPSVLEAARWEFDDLEKMIAGAEDLYGPYRWERYDVIVLPPSFPFGGMENPRLTFATPTILAGDRSLTSLIAHELAHSWSGNLVTNATWNDFWLNEGFTVYFEHRIMEKLYGRDYSEMLASLALHDLHETVDDLRTNNLYSDTRLQLDLAGRNPDDGVTDIAYNKGYFFLRSIEEEYGREKFDQFLNAYFSRNAFTSMDTNGFIAFIENFYQEQFNIRLDREVFTAWIYTEGVPPNCPRPGSDRFAHVEEQARLWSSTGRANMDQAKTWTTHEWMHFLNTLPKKLDNDQMRELDNFGKFSESGNAEILTIWFVHSVRNQYAPVRARLEEFLINTGRRKFLLPIYQEMIKTAEGKEWAKDVYRRARPGYHFVAISTFDKLLN